MLPLRQKTEFGTLREVELCARIGGAIRRATLVFNRND